MFIITSSSIKVKDKEKIMNNNMSYRQYLQYHANNHPSDIKRSEAQALLNVVGDDMNINGNFLTGEKVDRGWFRAPDIREKMSNGYNASTVNRTLNPWWIDSYKKYLDANSPKGNDRQPFPTPGSGGSGANAARNLALVNESLGLMPNELKRIDEAERNKYANIENNYNRDINNLENNWKQVQEDYNTARTQRLGNRRRQIDVANDDFKNQRDAYARYFARSGAGSSSMAQYTVPTMLARAAEKVRSTIEDNNAENAREQETNYNRQNLDYRRQKDDILTSRERQKQAAAEDFAGRRSNYWDEVAKLERQKADAQNRSTADIIAAGSDAVRRAQEQADAAVRAGAVTEGTKYKPIQYEETKQKDWTYDPTKTKIEDPNEEKDDDNSLYNKYFRDKEDEKKKKDWISATAA